MNALCLSIEMFFANDFQNQIGLTHSESLNTDTNFT